jgi:hypothetical protein
MDRQFVEWLCQRESKLGKGRWNSLEGFDWRGEGNVLWGRGQISIWIDWVRLCLPIEGAVYSFCLSGFEIRGDRDGWLWPRQCSFEHWRSHRLQIRVSPTSWQAKQRVFLAKFLPLCHINHPLKPRTEKTVDVAQGKPRGISYPTLN